MHRADIKAAIHKKGLTLVEFDKLHGFPSGSTSECLSTGRPSVERAISEFLNVPLFKLWPDRYHRDGYRINPRDRRTMAQKAAKVTTSKPEAIV